MGFGVETILRRFGKSRSPGNSAGDLVGMVKWPFQRLSDLQLGDKMVTLNHLADALSFQI